MQLLHPRNIVYILGLSLIPVFVTAGLPDPGMSITQGRTALVLTDPQNDFLSPEGVTWGVVGASVTANDTVKHIGQLFKSAKTNEIPHYLKFVSEFPMTVTDKVKKIIMREQSIAELGL